MGIHFRDFVSLYFLVAIGLIVGTGCDKKKESPTANTSPAHPIPQVPTPPSARFVPESEAKALALVEADLLQHWSTTPAWKLNGLNWTKGRDEFVDGFKDHWDATLENAICTTKHPGGSHIQARKIICRIIVTALTEADKLNGIEWRGSVSFAGALERTAFPGGNGWGDWKDGRPTAPTAITLVNRYLEKKNGEWTVRRPSALDLLAGGPGEDDGVPVSADTLPKKPIGEIGMVPLSTSHPYWIMVRKGAERASQETGAKLIWEGPVDYRTAGTDQLRIINNLAATAHGIAIAPANVPNLIERLTQLGKQIPIVLFDSGSKFKDYNALVATDNLKGGEMIADKVVRLRPTGGEIAVLVTSFANERTQITLKGFEDGLKTNKYNGVITSKKESAGDPARAQSNVQDILAAHPNTAVIICLDPQSTLGAIPGIEQSGKVGKCLLLGVAEVMDGTLEKALRGNEVNGLLFYDAEEIGYRTIKTIAGAIENEKVEKFQPVPPIWVDKATFNDPTIGTRLPRWTQPTR